MAGDGSRTPEATVTPDPEPATVAARIARARRTGNADHLWPDVARARRVAAGRAIAQAVRDALAGTAAALDHDDADAVGVTAFMLGVGPVLGWWIASGRLRADPAVSQVLDGHLQESRMRSRLLDAATLDVTRWCADRGVEAIVLKGRHLAHCYPEPGARTQGDIDLLLPGSARPMLERALRKDGWSLLRDDDPGHRASWTREGHRLPRRLDRASADDPWTLDLHWTLDRRYLPGIARAGAWDTVARATLPLGDGAVTVLGAPDLCHLTVLHASLNFDDLQLSRLVDLVMLTRHVSTCWDHVAERATAFGTLFACYPAAALVERMASGTVSPDVLDRLAAAATGRMRRVVAAADPGTLLPGDRRTLRQKLMWCRGTGDTIRATWRLLTAGGITTWRRRLRLVRAG